MRKKTERSLSFLTALMMALTLALFLPDTAVRAKAAPYENYFNKQDDKEVKYDSSYWIQPPSWNTPKIDPRDFDGWVMLFADKIGLEPEYAHGKVQRVYFSLLGVETPVSTMKFHIFYDTRLKVVENSKGELINPGKAVEGFTTGSAMVEEGQLAFYAYSDTAVPIEKASLFTIDFRVPEDAEPGELYPIGMSYVDDGVVCDTFMGNNHDFAEKAQMTFVFTKGIYNGYIWIIGDPRTKKADLTLKTPREGRKTSTDPNEWFGNIPAGVEISDMEWTELDSLNEFGEVDQFTAGKVYGLKFRLSPANGGLFSKKFEAAVNGEKVEYHGEDITNGGVFYTEIEALEKVLGDINYDGIVNIADLARLAAHIKGRKMLPDPTIADFNGDGKLNIIDLTKLAAHIKGKRLLIDPEYTDIIDIPD